MSGKGENKGRRGGKRREHRTAEAARPSSCDEAAPVNAARQENSVSRQHKKTHSPQGEVLHSEKSCNILAERPKWHPPHFSTTPIPNPECPYCGKSIRDMAVAIADKRDSRPVHFDCVVSHIAETESLDKGDSVAYIGGGRFAVVHLKASEGKQQRVQVKKIVEWEPKENWAPWRVNISDHYSLT